VAILAGQQPTARRHQELLLPHRSTTLPLARAAVALAAVCILALGALAAGVGTAGAAPARDAAFVNPPGILACPVAQPAKASAKPNPKLLAKLIRCLFEKKADPGMDGAVKIDVQTLKVGKSRPFIPATNGTGDLGNGGPGTIVWPVKVTWRWTTYYNSSRQVSDNISVFNCLLNTFDEWECGLAQRIKDGPLRSLPAA
jgi:hypothetical protein